MIIHRPRFTFCFQKRSLLFFYLADILLVQGTKPLFVCETNFNLDYFFFICKYWIIFF